MAILNGALTVRRFRVLGDLPSGPRESWRDLLNEHAFHESPVERGKEEAEGWVQVHNLLDTAFEDSTRWLLDPYLIFALRVDKKSLPAKFFNATLAKRCEAWTTENQVERCPAAVRARIKEELEDEWLKRTLPRVAVTECVWNIDAGWLLVHSQSDGVADRIRKRFLRTFGLELAPWSPLDWLDDHDLSESLIASAPFPIVEA